MAAVLEPSSTDALHRAFAATRDPVLRDELVRRHVRLAEAIASRFCNHSHDREDRSQVALLGLVNAVDRFDPERGVQFSTFAWATITGELKRFHRNTGWAPHVPRSLQESHLRVAAAIEQLTNELGRSPTVVEIAEQTGDSVEDVVQAIELNHARAPMSLDASPTASELVAPVDGLSEADDRIHIDQLLGTLPPRSQEIVRLRFERELSQSQIAKLVGLSQMHVSRLLAQALETLREAADADAGAPGRKSDARG